MSANDLDRLRAVAEAEQSHLNTLMVVCSAEGVVATTRINDLGAEYSAALRRVPAARGRLTRAQRTGDAARIAAAAAHLAEVQAAADRAGDLAIREGHEIVAAGLERTGAVLDQLRPTWDAHAAVTEAHGSPR